MGARRETLLREATAFASAGGLRPRAVVVVGAPGIGKTTFLERLQVELLAAGRASLVVLDDCHAAPTEAADAIVERIAADSRCCVLIAGEHLPRALARAIDSRCDRRIVEIPALDDAAARDLLGELGVQPWSLRAAQQLARAAGNPRALVDGAFEPLDVAALPSLDATLDGDGWSPACARWLQLAARADDAAADELLRRSGATAERGAATAREIADAHVLLAQAALRGSRLEEAVQHGERAASLDGAGEALRILGAAAAASARALRGEPTAALSMHALAGRAARASLPIVEASLWYAIASCAAALGDVVTSRRAAIRSVQLADASRALLLGLRARLLIADLHLAAREPGAATWYLDELADVARERDLARLRIDALCGVARAALALGDHERARSAADDAHELTLRNPVRRPDVVETAVLAARAHAAGGSVERALAPIEALSAEPADPGSPDFRLVLEAIRVLGRAGGHPAALRGWLARLNRFDADGHGGALRAAHAEADAWRAAVEGRRAEAARLAERARQLWVAAEHHDELQPTDPIVRQQPLAHGPRISLVGARPPATTDPAAFAVLTPREREIARYVAGGLTNPEIAADLHLSPRTVEHHVASILRKLELPNRRALVRGLV